MVFLHASEHIFNLSFSETLMLQNYSRVNDFIFCSMIGGAESIRDIHEAKNFFAKAFEFSLIESEFSLTKICSAFEKVFYNNLSLLFNYHIFINISTPDGIDLIRRIDHFDFPEFINKELVVFNIDRRMLLKNLKNIKDDNFEYHEFDYEMDPQINEVLMILKKLRFKTSLSGGITKRSLLKIFNNFSFPDYIKTGLFSLNFKDGNFEEFLDQIIIHQNLEVQILRLLRNNFYYRYNYINTRINHLDNYLKVNML